MTCIASAESRPGSAKQAINVWKWAVLAWGAHKAFKVGRALLRAKRLAKKKVRAEVVARYADL